MNKIKHGKVTGKLRIGDNMEAERTTTYQDGLEIDDRLSYVERFRVGSLDEAMHKVVELARRIEEDDSLIDPAFRYEGRSFVGVRGRLDVVFCYTKIIVGK